MALDHLALLIDYCRDRIGRYFEAFVGQDRVGLRDLHRRHFDPAQHNRRIGGQFAEAELLSHIAHPVETDLVGQPRGGGIERFFERELQRYPAEIAVLVILRGPVMSPYCQVNGVSLI